MNRELGNIVGEKSREICDKVLNRIRFSITYRLTLLNTLATISNLIIFCLLIILGIVFVGIYNLDKRLEVDYNLIVSEYKYSSGISKDKIKYINVISNSSVVIYDKDKKVIESSDSNDKTFIIDGEDKDKGIYRLSNQRYLVKYKKSNNESGFVSYIKDNLTVGYVYVNEFEVNGQMLKVQFITSLADELEYMPKVILGLGIVSIFIALISFFKSSRISKRMIRPVYDMNTTIQNIKLNSLNTRLNVSGVKDELKDLAQTFNDLLDRIQRGYESQNQFVSDASHELRTPIAVIQGYANLLDRWGKNDPKVLEEAIEAIKLESENMKGLIEKLLFLARSDKNTQKVEKSNFALNELVKEVVKETSLIDDDHNVNCIVSDEIYIWGDRKLLKEALRIFIDNSLKYTSTGGNITIYLSSNEKENILSIEDNGIGIPKEDLPKIFERFYRVDKSRTKKSIESEGGTGLGLSIAKWIIMQHKGIIEIQSAINIGTKVIIKLPVDTYTPTTIYTH